MVSEESAGQVFKKIIIIDMIFSASYLTTIIILSFTIIHEQDQIPKSEEHETGQKTRNIGKAAMRIVR